MGDWFQTLADIDAPLDEADQLALAITEWLTSSEIIEAARTDCALGPGHAPGPRYTNAVMTPSPGLLTLTTNGMCTVTERTVFHNGGLGLDRISCPQCHAVASWKAISDTIDTWYEHGHGIQTCAHCQRDVQLNHWVWEPAWAFGNLGFMFWNWPELRPEFVAEMSQRLGHRMVLVIGKL